MPPSPQIKDEAAWRPKRHFPITYLGGRGGLNFPFNLSKIVALDAIANEARVGYNHLSNKRGWIFFFIKNAPKLWVSLPYFIL